MPQLTVARPVKARVRRFIVDHDLVPRGGRLLVAISGGPDSTCLLLTLGSLRRSLGFELCAAHFDHQLQGRRGAAAERGSVNRLADALGVELHVGSGDVRSHARASRRSIEDAARDLRYRFLADVARGAGCRAVAVGHTRDDQAETVLLHILRGSGLAGLAGMAASAPWPVNIDEAPRLVRPLLGLSRADTERCCREAGVTPFADSSNRSARYTRNRVRRELLPALRKFNPRIDDALVRLGDAVGTDLELLERLASQAIIDEGEGEVHMNRRHLLEMPEGLRRHAVRLAVQRLLTDNRGLGERHVNALIRAARQTGSRLSLPRGVQAEVTRDALVLHSSSTDWALPGEEVELLVPGHARLGPWKISAEHIRSRPRNIAVGNPHSVVLNAEAIGARLSVRRRKAGDRFQPLGLRRPKKLQNFLVDAHVPRSARDAIPLVCGLGGIVWVVGQRPAEWAKVARSTKRFVRLRGERMA